MSLQLAIVIQPPQGRLRKHDETGSFAPQGFQLLKGDGFASTITQAIFYRLHRGATVICITTHG